MKRLMLAALAAALLPAAARAEDKPKRIDPSSAPDVQDVIFYGKTRPVLMRLHILVDGKPYSEAWDNYIKARFDYADRDGNGYLDRDAVRMIPSAQTFQQMVLGAGNFYNGGAARFEELDSDGDGKVTLAELKEYYQKLNVAAVRLMNANQVYGGRNFSGVGGGGGGVGFSGNQNNGLSEALFRHLDVNKDGKLTKEELAVADRLVARLDANDDELLDATELMQGQVLGGLRPPPVAQPQLSRTAMMPNGTGANQGPFFLVPREKEPNRLTQRLLLAKEMIARYDKDKSGKLTREEIGLDEELFNLLDRNEDRVLDAVELLRYVVIAPDVELTVHLGGGGSVRSSGVTVTPGSKANLARGLRPAGADAMVFGVQNARIEVRRPNVPSGVGRSGPNNQYFMQVFRSLDRGNKGFVELKAVKQPQVQYLSGMFEMADRDGDGKVTRKEFEDLLQLQAQAPGCLLTLSVGELGQGLFEILDTNRDGRLSVRELRTAWQSLAEYDRKKVGAVTDADIPHQFQLALTPGGNVYPALRSVAGQQPVRPSTAGPLWFRKMDRNGDGDVSPREFLGTPEQFKALDLDGDGYISLEEAEKADARLRKAKQLP
ncbi:MAG: EF-hand domain-containing protein [Planctomycetes bacterium]|nr:EF-hand domain-containing protein [Planctomycetota bacterium]